MDWTALGALLAGFGTAAGAVVAWIGKRGENRISHSNVAITAYSSFADDLQEERATLKKELLEKTTALAQEAAARAQAEAEIARLRRIVTDLGGDPS